ncbi:hypothetical protein DL98DRAFT_240218 [Cadophora sp. DSE1049]|nr:hypothetical protein DL98DRAFT_240218 [Cadophora sp. DSE1049]
MIQIKQITMKTMPKEEPPSFGGRTNRIPGSCDEESRRFAIKIVRRPFLAELLQVQVQPAPHLAPGHPGSRDSTKSTAGRLREMLRSLPNTCHKDSVTNSSHASALPHPLVPGTVPRDSLSSISSSSHSLVVSKVEGILKSRHKQEATKR